MPEDIPRSASERTPNQRDGIVPPAWWRELARTDLPVGADRTVFTEMARPDQRSISIEVLPRDKRRTHPRLAIIFVLAVVSTLPLLMSSDGAVQRVAIAIAIAIAIAFAFAFALAVLLLAGRPRGAGHILHRY